MFVDSISFRLDLIQRCFFQNDLFSRLVERHVSLQLDRPPFWIHGATFSQGTIEDKMIVKFVIVSIIAYLFTESVKFAKSDEPEKVSEPLSEEYCADLKGSMKNGSIEHFIKTVNIQWQVDGGPQSNDACQELLNQIFINCGIKTQVKLALRRPIKISPKKAGKAKAGKKKPNINATDSAEFLLDDEPTTTTEESTKTDEEAKNVTVTEKSRVPTEDAGIIDIRTLDEDLGNFVIKFRFGKRSSCASLAPLLKMLDVEMFKKLYPGKKVTLLALSFNTKVGPTLNDYIAVWAKGEEIVDTHRHSGCLEQPEFKDLNYKDKHIREYFKSDEATTKVES